MSQRRWHGSAAPVSSCRGASDTRGGLELVMEVPCLRLCPVDHERLPDLRNLLAIEEHLDVIGRARRAWPRRSRAAVHVDGCFRAHAEGELGRGEAVKRGVLTLIVLAKRQLHRTRRLVGGI